jgi:hypothetical protein
MGQNDIPSLLDLLRMTLSQLENAHGLDRSDPAYKELTRRIALTIAELEVAKEKSAAA